MSLNFARNTNNYCLRYVTVLVGCMTNPMLPQVHAHVCLYLYIRIFGKFVLTYIFVNTQKAQHSENNTCRNLKFNLEPSHKQWLIKFIALYIRNDWYLHFVESPKSHFSTPIWNWKAWTWHILKSLSSCLLGRFVKNMRILDHEVNISYCTIDGMCVNSTNVPYLSHDD